MSNESIEARTTPNKVLNPSLDYVGSKIRAKFRGDCLKQENITFNHEKIVNIYIVYEIERSVNISSYPIFWIRYWIWQKKILFNW